MFSEFYPNIYIHPINICFEILISIRNLNKMQQSWKVHTHYTEYPKYLTYMKYKKYILKYMTTCIIWYERSHQLVWHRKDLVSQSKVSFWQA